MIAEARKTGIYDRLDVSEMTIWLKGRRHAELDLIAACDCLIYFGDLRQVLLPAANLLRPGGCMAFTLEHGQTEPYRLTDSGRYSHSPSHVHQAAESAGLTVARITETILRYEYGEPVEGLVAVLRR
jgi:predicted TPR repeat methyltransferase